MNPFGVENMQEVQYQLQRAGVLSRPAAHLPPTTGVIVGGR